MRHVVIQWKNEERQFEVANVDAWKRVAEFVLGIVQPHNVIALSGPLGAGKTTFTQVLAKELGVEKHVQSPTFALMRSYATTHPEIRRLLHVDAYRLQSSEELRALDLNEELTHNGTILMVEWPEKMGDWLSHNKQASLIQIFIHA